MKSERLISHSRRFRSVLIVFLLGHFWPQFFFADLEAQEARKVRVGYSALSLAFLPHLMAKDVGIYDKHGLAVELIHIAGPIQVAALAAQEIDFGAALGPAMFAAGPRSSVEGHHDRDESASFLYRGRAGDEIQGFLDVAFDNKQIPQRVTSQAIVDYTALDGVLKERRGRQISPK